MSKPTHRTKNTCRQCGSSWTPRGTAVSNMCPECGSQDVVATAQLVRPKRRGGWKTPLLILGAVLVLGGGVAALVLTLGGERESTRATEATPKDQQPPVAEGPFKPGDAVRVKSRTRNIVLADEDVADELAQLRAANNQAGIVQLMRLHKDKVAEIPNGTKATVLGMSPHGVRVEVAEGGWKGRQGVLPADVLEPAN